MIYIKKYNSYKKFGTFNPSNNKLDFSKSESINKFFSEQVNKGWYTNIAGKRIIFYKKGNEVFINTGNENSNILVDDKVKIEWNSNSAFSFLKTFRVYNEEKKIFDLRYIGKLRLFKSYDFTMAQEEYDSDLLALIYFICSDEQRLQEFRQTGFYTS